MQDPKDKKSSSQPANAETTPINKKEEVEKSRDEHINQDFEGFPHYPAKEEMINPKTSEEKKMANAEDVENIAQPGTNPAYGGKKEKIVNENTNEESEIVNNDEEDEPYSVGSAGAFEASENVNETEADKYEDDVGKTIRDAGGGKRENKDYIF